MMKQKASNLRVGIVPYVNVLPLLEGLENTIPEKNWVRATPRELSGLLAAGEIDVASLPIFDALRSGEYSLVPDCAIASQGAVRSVQLFSVTPLEKIERVLLDRSSLTSINLAKLLCADLLKIKPEYILSERPVALSDEFQADGFDAAVVIGDVALEWDRHNLFPYKLDLGAAWANLTKLPFVYAAWVVHPETELTEFEIRAFKNARKRGERTAYEIARRVAKGDTRRLLDLVSYLSRSIHYRMGDAELEGIAEFRRRLISHGLLPENVGHLDVLPDPDESETPGSRCII